MFQIPLGPTYTYHSFFAPLVYPYPSNEDTKAREKDPSLGRQKLSPTVAAVSSGRGLAKIELPPHQYAECFSGLQADLDSGSIPVSVISVLSTSHSTGRGTPTPIPHPPETFPPGLFIRVHLMSELSSLSQV